MDQESSKESEKKLDDIPVFEGGEVKTYRVENKKCEHEFIYSRIQQGITAECVKCKAGLILTPGMEIKKKHVYLHGSLVC